MSPGPLVDQGTVALPSMQGAFNRFRVTVIRGDDLSTTYEASSEECSIGTSPGNNLVLTDPKVSGHHCVIRASSEGAMILDLGSTNGTRVGGLKVEAAFLTNGLTVEIGESVLRFEVLEDRITPMLSESNQFGGLFGVSAEMRRIFAIVERVANSDVPVLIEGETGVGKTALAELIHASGKRGDSPLLAVDLAAGSISEMETAIFGSGARPGALSVAAGGTVILEEVGQLPLALQARLLEALGSTESRIVATTQIDLREAVNSKRFRSDLFYRLSTIAIRVPPLRERREDIPPLIERFYSAESKGADSAPPAELVERLFWRPWPGNVSELRAAVERAALIDDPALLGEVGGNPTPPGAFEFQAQLSYRESKEQVVGQFERWYAEELIRRHGGNLSRAARAARMDRSYLRELLRRHQIPLPSTTRKK